MKKLDNKTQVLAEHLALGLRLLNQFGGLENLKRALALYEDALGKGKVLSLDPGRALVNGEQAKAARSVIKIISEVGSVVDLENELIRLRQEEARFQELLADEGGSEKRLLVVAYENDVLDYNVGLGVLMEWADRDLVIRRLGPKFPEIVREYSCQYGI